VDRMMTNLEVMEEKWKIVLVAPQMAGHLWDIN